MKKNHLVAIVFCVLLMPKLAWSVNCIADASEQGYGSQSLYWALINAKQAKCEKDLDNRQIISIKGMVHVNNVSIDDILKDINFKLKLKKEGAYQSGLKCESNQTQLILNSDNIVVENLYFEDCAGITIKKNNNQIKNNTIVGSLGDCVYIQGENSFVNNNVLVYCNHYGINVIDGVLEQLKNSEQSLKQLMCSNKILNTERKTNLLTLFGDQQIDDYDELTTKDASGQSKCDEFYCGGGTIPNSVCTCLTGYIKGADGKCFECDSANNYYKNVNNKCMKCEGNDKVFANNACTCKESGYFLKATTGTCEKCPEGYLKDGTDECTLCDEVAGYHKVDEQCVKCPSDNMQFVNGECVCKNGYKLDSEGECIKECTYDNTKKSETSDACVCKKGYASYGGMNDIPCVECGPNSTGVYKGECKCKNSYHISLNGDCVSDSLSCTDDDPNAILENKKCVCKPQFSYMVDPNGKPLCEQIPCPGDTVYNDSKGECLSADASACIEKGLEWDDEAGKCLGAESSGDCSCNFTGAEPTFAQALMPFIAVLFGAGGLFAWRKRRQ